MKQLVSGSGMADASVYLALGSRPGGALYDSRTFTRKLPLEAPPDTPLTITVQPKSMTLAPGTTDVMTVEVVGGTVPYHFDWLKIPGDNEADILLDAPSAPWFVVEAPDPDTSFKLYVAVTDNQGFIILSEKATVTATGSLFFSTQPKSKSVAIGGTADLVAAVAGGTSPYKFQWFEVTSGSSSAISGATSATYSAPTSTAGVRSYFCKATDAKGVSVSSQTAVVTVGAALTILAQPQSQTILSGQTVQVSIIPSGGITEYAYQWHAATAPTLAPIAGATSQVFVSPVLTSDAHYWCKVTDAAGQTVNSATATITVVAPGTFRIITQPQSQIIPAGQSATLSVEVTDGTGVIHYQWKLGTPGSGTDISGATSASYLVTGLLPGVTQSYYVVCTDSAGTPHTVTSAAATISVAKLLTITTNPESQSIPVGSTVGLSVGADGGIPSYKYKWQSSSDNATWVDISGATSAGYTSPMFTVAGDYYYRCIVTDAVSATATSASAKITVTQPFAFTEQPQSQTIETGYATYFAVNTNLDDSGHIEYQWYLSVGAQSDGIDYGSQADFDADYAYGTGPHETVVYDARIKLPGMGLADRQGNMVYSPTAVPGVCIEYNWNQLVDGTGHPGGSGMTSLIADVTAAQAAGYWVTLRVFCGVYAPDWVKTAAGHFTFVDKATDGPDETFQMPAFWSQAYIDAYRELMTALAAQFDGFSGIGAAVRHIQVSGDCTVDAEPMLLFRSNRAGNKPAYIAFMNGRGEYTHDQIIYDARKKIIDVHADVWQYTISAYSLNPANMLDVSPDSVTRALQVGDYAKAKLGVYRCMLHNHSLRARSQGAGYEAIYAAFGKGRGTAPTYRHALVGIQTAQSGRLFEGGPTGTMGDIIDQAWDMTALHVELPSGYRSGGNAAYISEADAVLKTNLLKAQRLPWS